ncbi:MAG TPA: hypothetical protein VF069_01645 [Streptosporangiaceae bacterium]
MRAAERHALAAGGRAEGTLRLRGDGGGWMRIGVAASHVLLVGDTSAALVTLSVDSPSRARGTVG